MNPNLKANKSLTTLAKSKGLKTWNELLHHIRHLPYGRNKSRTDFSLVFSEGKGTCSSKHALLKSIADENNLPVKLILCLYKMTEKNTPGIAPTLTEQKIDFIPEAHCYIEFENERLDLTNASSDLSRIDSEILEEIEITPDQIGEFKVVYHKEYLRSWTQQNDLNFSFEEIWEIREDCIFNLSKK